MFLGLTPSGIFGKGESHGLSMEIWGSHALNMGGLRGLKHSLRESSRDTSSQVPLGSRAQVVSMHIEGVGGVC